MNDSVAQCIFEGSKFFWRTRNNVDISIIDHVQMEVYEVVFYEPSIDTEAPRFYLDSNILRSMINNVEIENKTSFAKQNDIPLSTEFLNGLITKEITKFLIDRMRLEKFSQDERCLEISINLFEADLAIERAEQLFCSKPEGLVPFLVKHHKNLMADVVFQAMEAIQHEQKALRSSCNTALELSDIAHRSLSVRDRWRMPLVIGKVGRGQRLSQNDQKIFLKVQFNLQDGDDKKSSGRSKNSPLHSTTSTPRSCLTPPRTPIHRSSNVRKSSESTLCASTASSRLRYGADEGAAVKSPKTKTLSGPRRKKSSKVFKNRGAVSKEHSSGDTTTSCSGSASNITTTSADVEIVGYDSASVYTEDLAISSHIQRLVSGFKTLGSSIKTSFSMNKSQCAFDTIPEHEGNNATATTTTTSMKPAKRNSYFGSFLQTIKGSAVEVTAVDTTIETNQQRTKPVKRNSYFGSFIHALTGTTEATVESEEEAIQQSYLTIPVLSHFLRRKSEKELSSRKVLPEE